MHFFYIRNIAEIVYLFSRFSNLNWKLHLFCFVYIRFVWQRYYIPFLVYSMRTIYTDTCMRDNRTTRTERFYILCSILIWPTNHYIYIQFTIIKNLDIYIPVYIIYRILYKYNPFLLLYINSHLKYKIEKEKCPTSNMFDAARIEIPLSQREKNPSFFNCIMCCDLWTEHQLKYPCIKRARYSFCW